MLFIHLHYQLNSKSSHQAWTKKIKMQSTHNITWNISQEKKVAEIICKKIVYAIIKKNIYYDFEKVNTDFNI